MYSFWHQSQTEAYVVKVLNTLNMVIFSAKVVECVCWTAKSYVCNKVYSSLQGHYNKLANCA